MSTLAGDVTRSIGTQPHDRIPSVGATTRRIGGRTSDVSAGTYRMRTVTMAITYLPPDGRSLWARRQRRRYAVVCIVVTSLCCLSRRSGVRSATGALPVDVSTSPLQKFIASETLIKYTW